LLRDHVRAAHKYFRGFVYVTF